MAIDSSLWMADIPAGTYAVGDIVPLKIKAGPANVRSGRGTAVLKNMIVGSMQGTRPYWKIHIKNSDWIDDVQSIASDSKSNTSFARDGGNNQLGCDNSLNPNSGWEVFAECVTNSTSTSNDTLFAIIDVDYPSVSSVVNPDLIAGTPTSIPQVLTTNLFAFGDSDNALWSVTNVDYFKAGYAYCLQNVEAYVENAIAGIAVGFIAMSNAAGMGGLTRIIPFSTLTYAVRTKIAYSSKLVKGPMDVKVMAFASTAASANIGLIHEYVKGRIA